VVFGKLHRLKDSAGRGWSVGVNLVKLPLPDKNWPMRRHSIGATNLFHYYSAELQTTVWLNPSSTAYGHWSDYEKIRAPLTSSSFSPLFCCSRKLETRFGRIFSQTKSLLLQLNVQNLTFWIYGKAMGWIFLMILGLNRISTIKQQRVSSNVQQMTIRKFHPRTKYATFRSKQRTLKCFSQQNLFWVKLINFSWAF